MIYVVVFFILFAALLLITVSKDSYMNQELIAYTKQIREPWLHRAVCLNYLTSNTKENDNVGK